MEDCDVFYEVIELCEKSILHKLSLQKGSLVNWTVKKALEANIPKEIAAILLSEKVFAKAPGKIAKLLIE